MMSNLTAEYKYIAIIAMIMEMLKRVFLFFTAKIYMKLNMRIGMIV